MNAPPLVGRLFVIDRDTALIVVPLAVAAFVAVLLAVGLVRMAWGFLFGDDEMEAGGSWGKQLLTKDHREKRAARR